MSVTPIQTRYSGRLFRSRLEARWAVFFDDLGIPWQYEPEGYETPLGRYLPDFFLPVLNAWVEIKGDRPTPREEEILRHVADATDRRAFILWGGIESYAEDDVRRDPWRPSRSPSDFDGGYLIHGGWDSYHVFCECVKCGKVDIQFSGAANRNCKCSPSHGDSGHDLPWPDGSPSSHSPRLRKAYAAALSARFDGR